MLRILQRLLMQDSDFLKQYNWQKPIRSVGIRGADLVNDNYWEQLDFIP